MVQCNAALAVENALERGKGLLSMEYDWFLRICSAQDSTSSETRTKADRNILLASGSEHEITFAVASMYDIPFLKCRTHLESPILAKAFSNYKLQESKKGCSKQRSRRVTILVRVTRVLEVLPATNSCELFAEERC